MDMKPEYNHGKIEYYHLELWGKHIKGGAINAYKALNALRELGHYTDYSFWKFWSDVRERRQYSFFKGLYTFNESEYNNYHRTLTAAGTSPEACQRTVFYIVPKQTHSPSVDNQDSTTHIDPFRFSLFMNGFGEYALDKWAITNKVDEAYRLSIFASSPVAMFGLKPRVIRVWKKGTEVHFVFKEWVSGEFCDWQHPQVSNGQVNIGDWQQLHKQMITEFWTDKAWSESRGVDEITYFFEGFYQEQFRVTKSRVGENIDSIRIWELMNRPDFTNLLHHLPPHLHTVELFKQVVKANNLWK